MWGLRGDFKMLVLYQTLNNVCVFLVRVEGENGEETGSVRYSFRLHNMERTPGDNKVNLRPSSKSSTYFDNFQG